jgi:predicted secreted protein
MAATAGYATDLFISTDGSTWSALGGIKNYTRSRSADELDTTAFGGSQYRTSSQGLKRDSWSLDGDYISETAQNAIRTAYESGAAIYIKCLFDGTNGASQQVRVFNCEDGAAVDGLSTFTCTLQSQADATAVP